MRGVYQGWEEPQDHQGTQDPWASQAVMELLVKMGLQAYQGTWGRQVKRGSRVPQARGALQGREVGQDPPVVGVTTPRTRSP